MIEVVDLCKNYGRFAAVKNLNFKINKGEIVGFLGPNGAGKTTTMRMMTGFISPSSGRAIIDGMDVYEQPIAVKSLIGYLPETPPLYGDMNSEEYLTFVARLKGVPKSEVKSRVETVIEQMDLGPQRRKNLQLLSKGFRQRVGIAQALVSKPPIIILDEPTVGLDPKQVSEIRNLINGLRGDHTIILSTHILPEVEAICERVIIINSGQIVAQDTLKGLAAGSTGQQKLRIRVRRPNEALVTSLQTSLPSTQVFRSALSGDILEVEFSGGVDTQEQIISQVFASGAGVLEVTSEGENLEDVFIQLTSNRGENGVRP